MVKSKLFYLIVPSVSSKTWSVDSVLSGSPLAATLLMRKSFDRFTGLGVPGPFTFLRV